MNSSGYHGEFTQNGSTNSSGSGSDRVVVSGNQTGVSPLGFRQQQLSQQGMSTTLQDQIVQRRVDLLMGKRSFGDYLSYQQHIQLLRQQQLSQTQQPQQQQPLSYFQSLQLQQQQQVSQVSQQATSLLLLQNQNLIRSVKQRTNNNNNNNGFSPLIDLCNSPTNNNNNINNSVTRFGVPVYQPTRQQQQQIQTPFFNNFQNNNLNQSNNNNLFISNNNNNNNNINININSQMVVNPVQTGGFNSSSSVQPGSVVVKEDHKIINTIQQLEKHLLEDDDDDFGVANDNDGDAVSGLTTSDWSETFQNLMSPNPNLSSVSNNNNLNNSVIISPSPTSSTSSCCSTSAPATGSPQTTVTVPAKQLIADVATAISDGRNDVVNDLLSKLNLISDSNGSSEQRLAYYMYHALKSRACGTDNPNQNPELFDNEQMSAIYSLYDISPCFKFGLLAANLVMLEAITSAIQEGSNIHMIDFDIGHGAQYVNLLRALAERRARLPCTKMKITVIETGLGDQCKVPASVKDGLVALAERVGIKLECATLTRAINELSRESVGIVDGEAVVVNFAFKVYRIPDESVSIENLRDELLRRVKGLSPRAVTLVEQDLNGNTAAFVTRVNEAREYYGALFDSLEATLPRDNLDRCRVEKGLGRKMVNLVGFEGKERVERAEVFGKWRARMGMAGFELKPLSRSVAESMRAKLNSGRGGNPGFTVKEENGGVAFGWMGRNLTVASAWR